MLKTLLNSAILMVSLMAIPSHAAECGSASIQIMGATPAEKSATCEALHSVLKIFTQLNTPVKPKFTIRFQDEVLHPETKDSLYGYYDSETFEIVTLHFSAERLRQRVSFKKAWNDELAISYLLHEIAHMAILNYMGQNYKRITSTWHEALAYWIQLQTLRPKVREEILASYPTETFDSLLGVNGMIYGIDPDAFAVSIYRTVPQWGGNNFIKRLLDGKVTEAGPVDIL